MTAPSTPLRTIRLLAATIGGMDFAITVTADAFDVEIPEIGAVYTHMPGHDCHSIVAGAGHADA